MNEDCAYWHAINIAINASPQIYKLYGFFKNGKEAWKANETELKRAGASEESIERIRKARAELDVLKEYEKLQNEDIAIITQNDTASYPSLLAQIADPPPLLYCRGRRLMKDIAFPIAVVGSRKPTKEGLKIAELLCFDLAGAGCTLISGLALGIDAEAHKQAIAQSTATIAVLGSGASDSALYPKYHVRLAHEIVDKNGCLISEFPPNTKAERGYFPRRNRIIAGLSLACVVVQASYKSGALITARYSLEENREVMAVPGSVYVPQHQGTNELIKRGAHLITSARDVLNALNIPYRQPIQSTLELEKRTEAECVIIKELQKVPLSADELKEQTRLPASVLGSSLTLLEIDGIVKNIGGGIYILKNL